MKCAPFALSSNSTIAKTPFPRCMVVEWRRIEGVKQLGLFNGKRNVLRQYIINNEKMGQKKRKEKKKRTELCGSPPSRCVYTNITNIHGSGKIFCLFLSFFENLGRKKKKNQDFQDFCLFFSGSLEIFEIFEKS